MEISKFEPNNSRVENRIEIKPFGDTSRIVLMGISSAPRFNLCTMRMETEKKTQPRVYTPYRPSPVEVSQRTNVYVPPTFKHLETCSVKLSNLPSDITREKLYGIIKSNTKLQFTNLNLVINKETGLFRGFAFVTLLSKEEVGQFIQEIRNVVIDSLRISVELTK